MNTLKWLYKMRIRESGLQLHLRLWHYCMFFLWDPVCIFLPPCHFSSKLRTLRDGRWRCLFTQMTYWTKTHFTLSPVPNQEQNYKKNKQISPFHFSKSVGHASIIIIFYDPQIHKKSEKTGSFSKFCVFFFLGYFNKPAFWGPPNLHSDKPDIFQKDLTSDTVRPCSLDIITKNCQIWS